MALVVKQISSVSNTNVDLFTSTKDTVCSSVVVCNRTSDDATFRISIRARGTDVSEISYLYYDLPVSGNDTFIATIGITLPENYIVSIYSNTNNLTFNLFGKEI